MEKKEYITTIIPKTQDTKKVSTKKVLNSIKCYYCNVSPIDHIELAMMITGQCLNCQSMYEKSLKHLELNKGDVCIK